MSQQQQRAMGIMLGMACGDSVGAPFEFLSFKPEGYQSESCIKLRSCCQSWDKKDGKLELERS
jgi:hypothetical protein